MPMLIVLVMYSLSLFHLDGTACIWDVDNSNLLLKYIGHSGSVNSIAFHPREPLACTVSGDNGSHVWSFSVNVPSYNRQRSGSNAERTVCFYTIIMCRILMFVLCAHTQKQDSSGEDRYCSDDDLDQVPVTTLKSPLLSLAGHKGKQILVFLLFLFFCQFKVFYTVCLFLLHSFFSSRDVL